jgi:hypothetical protein
VIIDAPKPTENIWIGISHIFLPTFWCAKCDSWSSHHDKIHDERIRWQNMKNAQMEKQEEYIIQKTNTAKPLWPSSTTRQVILDETITTNDQTPHTVATTTRTNAHEMIASDHPPEIAPTPTRAAQVITTEMVPHSTKIKRNTR